MARLLEEIEARGWSDVEKIVCSGCLTDYALIAAVRDTEGTDPCDYCQTAPARPEASAPLSVILDLIVDGFRSEYEDPVEQVLYSSADGGYQMALLDAWDLIGNHEVTEDGDLIEDLASAIQQDAWVQRDPYAASPTDALRWGWDAFRTYVKHRRRYTFLARDTSSMYGAGDITMDDIPAALAEAVETAGQVRVLPAGSKWWRMRVHSPGERHVTASALGSPPDNWAKDNRMSPKGIGVFYGASTAAGARAEVAGYAAPADEGSIGQFELLRDVTVVDLTSVSDVPSLFDTGRRHERAPIAFMRGFVEDVTRIADPNDVQNLDYVPTQIVSEHFRYEMHSSDGPVEGILWRSSKDPSVTNCVIFAANDQMSDVGDVRPESLLVLDPTSVRVIPAPLGR